MYNGTVPSNNSHPDYDLRMTLGAYTYIFFCVLISSLGVWWNGTVIWLLGFCIKRTPFTTYILNLSVADIGLLILYLIWGIFVLSVRKPFPGHFHFPIFLFFYSAGQYLLTAISIDRCVAVLFPIWHRCHRSRNISPTVCASIWAFCFLFLLIHLTPFLKSLAEHYILNILFVANGFLCPLLMTISAVILLIKVRFKSQQRRQGKLIAAILLALLFFIICSFPANILFLMDFVFHLQIPAFFQYSMIFPSLNSSVNPLIYFLVGRQKKGTLRHSMKAAFQNVFKEDENPTEE